jgi:anaphase-promoting complex subunit 8
MVSYPSSYHHSPSAPHHRRLTPRASELLSSIPKKDRSIPHLPFSPPPQMQDQLPPSPHLGPRPSLGDFLPPPGPVDSALAGPSKARTAHGVEVEEEVDILEEDEFQLAKSYYDMKEFDRVVWLLQGAKGSRSRFLRIYSAYLVSTSCRIETGTSLLAAANSQSADRKAQEGLPHFLDTKQERLALFRPLNELLQELEDDSDPYLVYLRGLLLMRLDRRDDAIRCFEASVRERPYNWSAWSQMAQLVNSAEMVRIKCSYSQRVVKLTFGP